MSGADAAASFCSVKDGGVRKGAWSAKEDELLSRHVKLLGEGRWRKLAQKAGLNRSGKSCRLRWLNYLRPGIKRGDFSADEEELILKLHRLLGNRWALIAGRLPGRTDNEVKNYWNTILIKKVQGQQASDSGLTIGKFQAEDTKVVQDFSWRTKLQQMPHGQAEESNFLTDSNNVGLSINVGESSSPSMQIDDQDDSKSLISPTEVFDTNDVPLISDAFNFDYSYEASDELENGDQKPGRELLDLQHMEVNKIASLLDIENELRELL